MVGTGSPDDSASWHTRARCGPLPPPSSPWSYAGRGIPRSLGRCHCLDTTVRRTDEEALQLGLREALAHRAPEHLLAGQVDVAELDRSATVTDSRMKVPLAAILGQHIIDIDFNPPDHRPGIRRSGHDALVEDCGGVYLTTETRTGSAKPTRGRANATSR